MKIIIDSNIVFSALLNSNSKIGELLLQGGNLFDFYTIEKLRSEIFKYKDKILKLSKISEIEFLNRFSIINKNIKYVEEDLISNEELKTAYHLTNDIDVNDTLFVALAINLNCKLWTGDKMLINGLRKKGFTQFVDTNDLFQLYISRN